VSGAYKSGVHRPTFSPQRVEARRWLAGVSRIRATPDIVLGCQTFADAAEKIARDAAKPSRTGSLSRLVLRASPPPFTSLVPGQRLSDRGRHP
jgi:hypothetical protein